MSEFITFSKVTVHPVTASRVLGSRRDGISLPSPVVGNERPIKAFEVAAATAEACAYASAAAATNALAIRKQTQHFPMWAFRGHEPWRDPA